MLSTFGRSITSPRPDRPGRNKLTIAENDGVPVESGYGALTLKQVVFFSHMMPRTQKGYHVVVDLNSNLATVFEVWDRK